jgi:hypothetical protein
MAWDFEHTEALGCFSSRRLTNVFQDTFCGRFGELETFLRLTHLFLLYRYQSGARSRHATHAIKVWETITIYLK